MVQFFDSDGVEHNYHIEPRLLKSWDRLKARWGKSDEDKVFLVDGMEGSGKSVFAFQQAKYIDPTFNVSKICFTPSEFLNAIQTAKKGQVIVFDEAFRGLSSKSSISKTNKVLVQALMEMRQKNLIVFIVLPTFFLLEMYVATVRSTALFHIYKSKKGDRRMFRVYTKRKKNLLYTIGKKNGFDYRKPTTMFRGYFFNKYAIDRDQYLQKKGKALFNMIGLEDDGEKITKKEFLNNAPYYVLWQLCGSYEKAAKKMKELADLDLTNDTIKNRSDKYVSDRRKDGRPLEKREKDDKASKLD